MGSISFNLTLAVPFVQEIFHKNAPKILHYAGLIL